jgi:hypothetical protein
MPTPTWVSGTGGGSLASASVNQLLGTHQTQEIFEGAATVTVTTNVGTIQSLLSTTAAGAITGVSYSQPFTMSGTEIDRVVLPLTVLNGIGADVTVQLYNDSAGSPGTTASGAYVLPREFLAGAGLVPDLQTPVTSAWTATGIGAPPAPIQQNLAIGSAFDGSNNAVIFGGSPVSALSTVTGGVFVGQLSGNLTWTPAQSFPNNPDIKAGGGITTASYGISTPGVCFAGNVVVMCGGAQISCSYSVPGAIQSQSFYGVENYTATLSSGTLGSWVTAPNFPNYNSAAAPSTAGANLVAVGPATTGVDTGLYRVYAVGMAMGGAIATGNNSFIANATTVTFSSAPVGFFNGQTFSVADSSNQDNNITLVSGAGTTTWTTSAIPHAHGANVVFLGNPQAISVVYSAQVTASGQLGAWRQDFLGGGLTTSGAIGYLNGWIVLAGGATTTNVVSTVWGARVKSDNSIGPWIAFPALPQVVETQVYGVYKNTFYVIGGLNGAGNQSTVYGLTVLPSGPASSWTTTAALNYANGQFGEQAFISPSTGTVYVPGGGASVGNFSQVSQTSTLGTTISRVSVPLRITGLSNATKYHMVVSQVTANTFGGSNSPANTTGVYVGTSVSGGGGFTGLSKIGSGSWTTLTTGQGIPMTIYQGQGTLTQRVLHYLEDVTNNVPARQTWLVYDTSQVFSGVSTGLLRAVGEHAGNSRIFKTLTYDSTGVLQSTGSVNGWGTLPYGYSPGGATPDGIIAGGAVWGQ